MKSKPVNLVFKCDCEFKEIIAKAFKPGYFFNDSKSGLDILRAFRLEGTVEIKDDIVNITATRFLPKVSKT